MVSELSFLQWSVGVPLILSCKLFELSSFKPLKSTCKEEPSTHILSCVSFCKLFDDTCKTVPMWLNRGVDVIHFNKLKSAWSTAELHGNVVPTDSDSTSAVPHRTSWKPMDLSRLLADEGSLFSSYNTAPWGEAAAVWSVLCSAFVCARKSDSLVWGEVGKGVLWLLAL